MAEVISCASAVFSLGWILYESGQVMSHDIHDILQKCQNHIPLLHSPAWLWVGITRIAHFFSQRLEMRVKLSEGAVGETYVTCHNLLGLVHSIDMEIRNRWFTANFEHGRGEEVWDRRGSLLKVKLSWIFDIPDSALCARSTLCSLYRLGSLCQAQTSHWYQG